MYFCQENGGGEEILNLLKHVRPGNGFQFKGDMFDKVRRIYSLASTININIFRIVLKTNLNIARVQNCSDITILNMFLSGWSGWSGWSGGLGSGCLKF